MIACLQLVSRICTCIAPRQNLIEHPTQSPDAVQLIDFRVLVSYYVVVQALISFCIT